MFSFNGSFFGPLNQLECVSCKENFKGKGIHHYYKCKVKKKLKVIYRVECVHLEVFEFITIVFPKGYLTEKFIVNIVVLIL